MKMRCIAAIAAVLGLGLTVALVSMVGCDTPSTNEAGSYFDDNPFSSMPRDTPGGPVLTVTPTSQSITNASQLGQALLFSAKGGKDPVTWELVNESAGTLTVEPNGRDAVYNVDTLKANTLIARDANGSAALASIKGADAPSLAIASSDDPELVYDGELILLYAQGGIPPYDWNLVYPQRGQIVHNGAGNTFIEYMRVDEPDQVIVLTDGNGAMAELRIGQPDEDTGGGTNGTGGTVSPLLVEVDPAILENASEMARCTVTGGTPPYTWKVVYDYIGNIIGSNTGSETVYMRAGTDPGDNAVVVTDSSNPPQTTYHIIQQP